MRFEILRPGDRRCVRCPSCGWHPIKMLVDPIEMVQALFQHWRKSPNCY